MFYDSPLQRRRLTILNALFLTLQRCECKPSQIRSPSPYTRDDNTLSILIGDQHVGFTLEPVEQKRPRGSAAAKAAAASGGPSTREMGLSGGRLPLTRVSAG